MIGSVLGTLAVLIVAVVVAVASSGHHSGNGCIDVTIPYAFGGQEFYRCGAAARSMCRDVDTPAGFGDAPGRIVATQCRKIGLPVG